MKSRARRRPEKIIFVTGTDTGVGKTIFTGLLVHHLRNAGIHALAMKPFCSGGRGDVRLLRAMQDGELTEDEINPFYFPEPVAPLVSSRQHNRAISPGEVVRQIDKISTRCEYLLIEGSGGLLVPLGEKFLVADLIKRLECEVVVVSRNRLGTINHTLLTVNALKTAGVKKIAIAFMEIGKKDASMKTNGRILSELLRPVRLFGFEFLGKNASKSGVLKKSHRKVKKTLARMYR
ncbi:MAG TPA: dethiobiotin synthase [Verrucomicrobiae bacterium]|jgi:dethiobiotin synthetase|nr:dethiobiotin synthase [Verrucomicrobiae bacterium]